MVFWHTFINSIKLPSKKALFKLNRSGMDIAVIYLFILVSLSSIPSLINRLMVGSSMSTNSFFLFIFFLVFYLLPVNIIVFLAVSFFSFLFQGVTKLMRRKLRFSILWKMTAYATTIPFLIFTIINLFTPVSNIYLWLSILYTLLLVFKMISIYPKRKQRLSK